MPLRSFLSCNGKSNNKHIASLANNPSTPIERGYNTTIHVFLLVCIVGTYSELLHRKKKPLDGKLIIRLSYAYYIV